MKEMAIPTIEELEERRKKSLAVSEKAIAEHSKEYLAIKKMVKDIISGPLDIGDYYKTAIKLSNLLSMMCNTGNDSIFYYYYQLIDPRQQGQARYFRVNCLDLYEQLKCVDQDRTIRHKVRIIH
jgi:hypothetical protein